MSAFLRRQPLGRAVEVGVRPGLHGQTLLSTGIADLDRLLGGGLPLGSLLLLLEDSHSQQHLAFIKHYLAEGVACGHSAAWLAPRPVPGGAAAFVPSVAAARQDSGAEASTSAPGSNPASAAGQAPDGDDGLRIAWQYRKYIQRQQQEQQQAAAATATAASAFTRSGARAAASAAAPSSGSSSSAAAGGAGGAAVTAAGARALEAGVSREWCHRFDASRPIGEAALAASRLQHTAEWGPRPLDELSDAALAFVRGLQHQYPPAPPGGAPVAASAPLPVRDPSKVGRLVVQSLGSLAWDGAGDEEGCGLGWLEGGAGGGGGGGQREAALLQVVARLRLAAQESNCAVLVTCPGGLLSAACLARLQHLADGVLSLESLADDSDVYRLVPDQASAAALLHVRRLPGGTLWRPRAVEEPLFVVRGSRRRGLALTPFEVDPDAAEGREQGGGGGGNGSGKASGGKPAAAMLCAGPGGASKAFDF